MAYSLFRSPVLLPPSLNYLLTSYFLTDILPKSVGYTEEDEEQRSRREETPSLSFSNTETLSSWMREANMDADIQSYTKSSVLRRDEYFFRLW